MALPWQNLSNHSAVHMPEAIGATEKRVWQIVFLTIFWNFNFDILKVQNIQGIHVLCVSEYLPKF